MTQLRYLSSAYFCLEALALNEFGGSTIDCSGGLGAGLTRFMRTGLTTASPLQQAVLAQLSEPQPGWVSGVLLLPSCSHPTSHLHLLPCPLYTLHTNTNLKTKNIVTGAPSLLTQPWSTLDTSGPLEPALAFSRPT
jgi:hypothetical protein